MREDHNIGGTIMYFWAINEAALDKVLAAFRKKYPKWAKVKAKFGQQEWKDEVYFRFITDNPEVAEAFVLFYKDGYRGAIDEVKDPLAKVFLSQTLR